MTLNQLIYRIKNHVESGKTTNQTNLSNRQIAFDIHQMRSLLIRREETNLNPVEYQQSIVFDLEPNTIQEGISVVFNELMFESSDAVYRSKTTIPKRIELVEGINLKITSDIFKTIDVVRSYEIPYQSFNKFSGGRVKACEENGYIYLLIPSNNQAFNTELIGNNQIDDLLKTPDQPTTITAYSIFENPESISSFDFDQSYPCSNQMTVRIVESLIKRYYQQDRNLGDTETNLEEDDEFISG